MKTQISNLINGSSNTIRNINAAKYADNIIGTHNGQPNTPALGGTPTKEREAIAAAVAVENPESMSIKANGVVLNLTRHSSTSGKTWTWDADITGEQYAQIAGMAAPTWKSGASYSIQILKDCTVALYATSGKKGFSVTLGEEFIEIL